MKHPVLGWYGVFDDRGELFAVEEGLFSATEIAKRLAAETKIGFSVQPVGIVPPEIGAALEVVAARIGSET